MKVWLLESENSFTSYETSRFIDVASREGIDLKLVAPKSFDIIATKGGKKSLMYMGEPIDPPASVIPRGGAHSTYFALAVIRQLEKLRVLVLNSSQSIEVAKDKLATMQILASNNIPIPKTMLAKFPLNLELVQKEFVFPLIIKTVSGSQGKGVFLCENMHQLEDLAGFIETSMDPKVNVIIQEFVSSSRGRDIRVFVVGGRPIGAMLRTAQPGKLKANVHAGGSVLPYELNPEIEWLAVECAMLLSLDIAGVDILFDGDSYKVAEVNSSPGFRGFEQATGINIPNEIFNYIKVRMGRTL